MTSRHDSSHRRMYRRYVPVHQRMRNILAYMQKRAGPVPDTLFVCFVPFSLARAIASTCKELPPRFPNRQLFFPPRVIAPHCKLPVTRPFLGFLLWTCHRYLVLETAGSKNAQVSRGDGGVSRHGSGGQDCRTTGTAQPGYCSLYVP